MSLKSIDLQLTMNRSLDAGQVQNQLAQKPVGDQAAAALQSMKQQELDRTRSTRTEKSSDGKIRDGDNHKGGSGEPGGRAEDGGSPSEEQAKPREAKHPYKGKFIDLSL